jgi:hypothetical protein
MSLRDPQPVLSAFPGGDETPAFGGKGDLRTIEGAEYCKILSPWR